MAEQGRRWLRRRGTAAAGEPSFKRPSERAGAGQQEVSPRKVKAERKSSTPERILNPSPAAMRRAAARLDPPKAAWHPLPLAELAIVLGGIGMVIAALRGTSNGILAGFLLILAGTAEFSWREHHHGYRQHGAVLAGIIGMFVAVLVWKFLDLPRNYSVGVGVVVFFLGWGVFSRGFEPRTTEPEES